MGWRGRRTGASRASKLTSVSTPSGNITCRSGFEAAVAEALVRAGATFQHEPMIGRLEYVSKHVYIPDFRVWKPRERAYMYIEAKGYFPGEDRRKMRAVKEAHPEADIRLVFQRSDTPIKKGSRTTYAMWAAQYGFPCADGVIPAAWFLEMV